MVSVLSLTYFSGHIQDALYKAHIYMLCIKLICVLNMYVCTSYIGALWWTMKPNDACITTIHPIKK